ncbi:hypothetical protein D3C87_2067760 [compost metagenome]
MGLNSGCGFKRSIVLNVCIRTIVATRMLAVPFTVAALVDNFGGAPSDPLAFGGQFGGA